MTRFVLFIFCWLFLLTARGQVKPLCPEYPSLIKAGNDLLAQKKYQHALNKFNAARLCLPDSSRSVDQRIKDLFVAIEGEKDEALRQKDLADKANKKAQEATQVAEMTARQIQALYWANESEKLDPPQAIRLLELAGRLYLDPLSVYERIFNRFTNATKEPFAQAVISLAPLKKMEFGYKKEELKISSNGQYILFKLKNGSPHDYIACDLQGKYNLVTETATGEFRLKSTAQLLPGQKETGQVVRRYPGWPPRGHQNWTIHIDQTKIVQVHSNDGSIISSLQHDARVLEARFFPDSTRLLTICDDYTARIWYLPFVPTVVFQHPGLIRSATFSADSKQIITVGQDSIARVWNLNGELLRSFRQTGPLDNLYKLVPFDDRNGYMLRQGDPPLTSRNWSTSMQVGANHSFSVNVFRKGQSTALTTLHTNDDAQAVDVSPDGCSIISINKALQPTIRFWNCDGKAVDSLKINQLTPYIGFSADGLWFYTQSYVKSKDYLSTHNFGVSFYDGETVFVTLYNLKTKQVLTTLGVTLTASSNANQVNRIISVDVSEDGNRIITTQEEKSVKLWNRKGQLLMTMYNYELINAARLSPDGNRYLAVAGQYAFVLYTAEGALNWLKENNDKVAPLSEELRSKYGIPLH